MSTMVSGVYNGVGFSNIHRGLWQSYAVIAGVALFSEVEDLDHFKQQF